MADRKGGMVQAIGYPSQQPATGAMVTRAVAAAAANNLHSGRTKSGRNSKRYSVSAFYSMAAEQDNEVEDELAQAQRSLRDLKSKISGQSKKNFVLERDVRYLDSRIALLIQNRIALDEVSFFFVCTKKEKALIKKVTSKYSSMKWLLI